MSWKVHTDNENPSKAKMLPLAEICLTSLRLVSEKCKLIEWLAKVEALVIEWITRIAISASRQKSKRRHIEMDWHGLHFYHGLDLEL